MKNLANINELIKSGQITLGMTLADSLKLTNKVVLNNLSSIIGCYSNSKLDAMFLKIYSTKRKESTRKKLVTLFVEEIYSFKGLKSAESFLKRNKINYERIEFEHGRCYNKEAQDSKIEFETSIPLCFHYANRHDNLRSVRFILK